MRLFRQTWLLLRMLMLVFILPVTVVAVLVFSARDGTSVQDCVETIWLRDTIIIIIIMVVIALVCPAPRVSVNICGVILC